MCGAHTLVDHAAEMAPMAPMMGPFIGIWPMCVCVGWFDLLVVGGDNAVAGDASMMMLMMGDFRQWPNITGDGGWPSAVRSVCERGDCTQLRRRFAHPDLLLGAAASMLLYCTLSHILIVGRRRPALLVRTVTGITGTLF